MNLNIINYLQLSVKKNCLISFVVLEVWGGGDDGVDGVGGWIGLAEDGEKVGVSVSQSGRFSRVAVATVNPLIMTTKLHQPSPLLCYPYGVRSLSRYHQSG